MSCEVYNKDQSSLFLYRLKMGEFLGALERSASPSPVVLQPNYVTNSFGMHPAMPQLLIAQDGKSPSNQHEISSISVYDKPAPVRISSLLASRGLLLRRVRPPSKTYHPEDDDLKDPFYSDEEEYFNTPKVDALIIPKENTRVLFIQPNDDKENLTPPKDVPNPLPLLGYGKSWNTVTNGANHDNNKDTNEVGGALVCYQKPSGAHENHNVDKDSSASEAEIESLMPKLQHAEYYTEPRIQELVAKERMDPGYCRRVKDFVIGRHGYGSIKFFGETNVCRLELESVVQFNKREVIVYMDETKKPPIGQGLNKPAEVTLLNIKCIDKKSGKQLGEGSRVEKYKEMLKKKAEEQEVEYVSYDAVKGEWKFKVEHFSSYKIVDED